MRKICFLSMLLPLLSFGQDYHCLIDDPDLSGRIAIVKSEIQINLNDKIIKFNNCDSQKDDYGLTLNCDDDDFIILINNELSPATGTVMSTSLDLFVDLDC